MCRSASTDRCYRTSRASADDSSRPETRTRLSRDFSPDTSVRSRWGTSSTSERKARSASLAAPSTGGAARRMRTASPRVPSTRVRGDRGMTRMVRMASARGLAFFNDLLRRRLQRLGLARTMEQELVVAGARLVLVANELERAIQRLDGGLDRALGVAAPQLHLVDVVIQFLETGLRLLQNRVGRPRAS